MCSKLDAGYMTGLIELDSHRQLERRVFLELPLALADNPADEEVGGEAKKACAVIRSMIAKDLEQRRNHSLNNIATSKAEISRLEVRVEQFQEEIARISSVEKTLAAFFGPEAPAVDKQAALDEFSTPKGLA